MPVAIVNAAATAKHRINPDRMNFALSRVACPRSFSGFRVTNMMRIQPEYLNEVYNMGKIGTMEKI
ncbi:hypothetical protein [Aquisphaera insulae]|uniref:hypothetical protein n=1 Tax=Aquisphaera insulae TaxID=2712864 RepID=UPI0013EC28F3|nr:hypothetical protein [Aquisphaera insulae]